MGHAGHGVGTQPREGACPWTKTSIYPTAVRLIFTRGVGSLWGGKMACRPREKCAHDRKGRGELATTVLGGLAEVPRHHPPVTSMPGAHGISGSQGQVGCSSVVKYTGFSSRCGRDRPRPLCPHGDRSFLSRFAPFPSPNACPAHHQRPQAQHSLREQPSLDISPAPLCGPDSAPSSDPPE